MIPCCDTLAFMEQIFETHHDSFTISTDPARLDMNAVYDFLSRAYWAKGRPPERTQEAVKNSLVFGLYQGQKQIGMARDRGGVLGCDPARRRGVVDRRAGDEQHAVHDYDPRTRLMLTAAIRASMRIRPRFESIGPVRTRTASAPAAYTTR